MNNKESYFGLLEFIQNIMFDNEMSTVDIIQLVKEAYKFTHKEDED